MTGRLVLAILATIIISRRGLIRVFLIPGLVILPIVFGYAAHESQRALEIGIFFVGLFTVGQFSFWVTTCRACTRFICVELGRVLPPISADA